MIIDTGSGGEGCQMAMVATIDGVRQQRRCQVVATVKKVLDNNSCGEDEYAFTYQINL